MYNLRKAAEHKLIFQVISIIRNLALVFFVLLIPFLCFAEDIYVSESEEGDGSSCSSSKSMAWLNTAGNWGAGAGKVSAGDTVHLCGTLTSQLKIQGSGSAGLPITILFETGAKFSRPEWSTGPGDVLYGTGTNYITVDGGTNGLIEATDNGTLLTYKVQNGGVTFTNSSNIEVKNLTIRNLYVRPATETTETNDYGLAINYTGGGSNIYIHDNVITECWRGVKYNGTSGSPSNINIYNNKISKCGWAIVFACDGGTVSSSTIHDNELYDGYNWYDDRDAFHIDPIHTWGNGGSTTGLKIYGNYIHGNWGAHNTSFIYVSDTMTSPVVYNNLLVNAGPSNPTDGMIYFLGTITGAGIYNNTIVGGDPVWCTAMELSSGVTVTVKNNIATGVGQFIYNSGATVTADYNISNKSTGFGSQPHGWVGDPGLDANYRPQASSTHVVNQGTSLSSYFTTDKDGISRPQDSAWDIGAYEYRAGSFPPMAPRNVRILQ